MPLVYTDGKDQRVVMEILIDHDVDLCAHDRFGVTVGSFALNNRVKAASLEDPSHCRVIDASKARGFPLPPTSRTVALATSDHGN